MRFSILKKFVIAFLLLSLLPLVVLSLYAHEKLIHVAMRVESSSKQALLKNSTDLLETRARAIARQIELFLQNVSGDLRSLSLLPVNTQEYLDFYRIHSRQIWIRSGSADHIREEKPFIPLYREITFANADGFETIRVFEDKVTRTYRDVSTRFWGSFGEEDYFSLAKSLPLRQLYVSHLKGRHVHKMEQLQGATSVETAVGGRQYDGIIRFAKPVYRDGRFFGVVSLALDHRHLMEYTQHVLPIGNREVVFPSYTSGNYAFLFDDEGWIITHPKFWDIRGYHPKTGKLIDPTSAEYNEESLKDGHVPFNLLHVPFIHPNYRTIALNTLEGKSGVTTTSSVGGVDRVMAYAPIRFDMGEYQKTGIFGGVTLGARSDTFHEPINEASAAIAETIRRTMENFILIILAAACLVGIIAVVAARSFNRPIGQLSEKVAQISRGQYHVSVDIHTGDELEMLGNNIEQMGYQLEKQRQSLIQSLEQVEISRNKTEEYSRRLEKQLEILNHIHSASHLLSVNFDQEKAFAIILKACVHGLGFDRAMIYMYDAHTDQLRCADSLGLDPVHQQRARTHPFHVSSQSCVPVRVFKTGNPVWVTDPLTDANLTELDRKIIAQGNTTSFAFVPISMSNRVLGVLGADHATSHKRISEEEIASLNILANEAAMAVERVRLMEEALKERDFVERIVSNMVSGILVIDANGKIQTLNPYGEAVFQVSVRQIAGQHFTEAFCQFPPLITEIENAMEHPENREVRNFDLEFIDPDNIKKFLEMTISVISGTHPSRDRSILVNFRDISQRKKIENHLRRSDRLVSLGTLAAGVAHEIRNPLTGISLLLDDLHDRMADRKADQVLMQQALDEIEKLEKMVTELLAFSANPASRYVPSALPDLIENTLFLVKKQCARQHVELVAEIASELPVINVDPEKLKQAILNVLLNGLNALPNGGSIRLQVEYRPVIGVLNQVPGIAIIISDTGPGIDPQDIEYIFDPFFTRSPKGFGLGLSITHTIIEEHGGKILAQSEPGQGACFKIFLPLNRETHGTNSGC